MLENSDVPDELIKKDIKWLKEALRGLTAEQRCIILDEYIKGTGDYSIGIKEYNAFILAFDDVEED